MYKSLAHFTNRLFDYAGLFPPESLELPQSLLNFAAYQQNAVHRECLGKFIFPVEKDREFFVFLKENKDYFSPFKGSARFSILLSKSKGELDFLEHLRQDLEKLDQIKHICGQSVCLASFEILPYESVLVSRDQNFIFSYLEKLKQNLFDFEKDAEVYLEVPFLGVDASFFLESLSLFHENNGDFFSVKLRTGGTTPAQIPCSADLAKVLVQCAMHSLPVKFTAGLHAPFPNFNPSVGVTLHGFLNVVCSSLLCYACFDFGKIKSVDVHLISEILDKADEQNFHFTDEGLKINDVFLENDLLVRLRNQFVKSIGTCSFLEPLAHLENKG